MGYDMMVVTKDDDRTSLADVAVGTWDSGLTDAQRNERFTPRYYLRRNLGAQPHLRQDLVDVGAAFDDYDFESGWGMRQQMMGQEFPQLEGEYEEHFDSNGDPVTDHGREYQARVEAHLRWRPDAYTVRMSTTKAPGARSGPS